MSLVAYESSGDESEEEVKSIKKQETVKIRIPSLREFQDSEDEPVSKKQKIQKNGLLDLLPPPKNASSFSKPGFVPHSLSSKKEQPAVTSTVSKSKPVCPELPPVSSTEEHESENESIKDDLNEESSKETATSDFFWLDDLASSSKARNESTNSNLVEPLKSNNSSRNLTFQLPSPSTSSISHPAVQPHYNYSGNLEAYSQLYPEHSEMMDTSEVEENSEINAAFQQQPFSNENFNTESISDPKEALLKDKEFLKLQGKRREFEAINIIDVKADDHLADKNEWLMKSITEETTFRPKRKHNMPTQQQKRKHQITFLAFQAKEREMDLKNQWALNNRTRRETQAKYGF